MAAKFLKLRSRQTEANAAAEFVLIVVWQHRRCR
jgi:hypothetical protein